MLRSIRDALKSNPVVYRRYQQDYQKQVEKIKKNAKLQKLVQQFDLSDEIVTKELPNLRQWLLEQEHCGACTSLEACQNLFHGHVSTPVYEDGELSFEWVPCQRFEQYTRTERQKRLLKSHFIPKEHLRVSFEDLTKDKGNGDAIKAAILFCMQFSENRGSGLYLYGEFGVGKTYLMGAIANDLTNRGHSVYFVHVPTFFREIKASLQDHSFMEKITELENVDCLILDDIGAESFSPWLRDEVLGPIIQFRTQNEKPILYTSNLDYDTLRAHLADASKSQIDELKAFRIAERIRSYTDAYKMFGENRRR